MSALDDLEAIACDGMPGWVIDFACVECGRRVVEPAGWAERPVCCEWDMVDLLHTLRRGYLVPVPGLGDPPGEGVSPVSSG